MKLSITNDRINEPATEKACKDTAFLTNDQMFLKKARIFLSVNKPDTHTHCP